MNSHQLQHRLSKNNHNNNHNNNQHEQSPTTTQIIQKKGLEKQKHEAE